MITKKILFSVFISILSINSFVQTAYDDDAAEVDYYVPGILANDAMQQVNFLLCFMESVNFSTFIDKGVYKALTDEAKCETASGADAASEAASATGGSANGGGGAGTANAVDAAEYTSGIYQGVTSGDTVVGKGWVDIAIDGQNDIEVPTTAYLSINVTADKSESNRFGTFTMRYDLRNKEANEAAGFPQANVSFNKGYLSVDNTTIEYRETGIFEPDRIIVADLADANDIQGYMQTILVIEAGGGETTFGIRHQVHVNEGADRYCQKFESANVYFQGASGVWTESTSVSGADLANEITAADYVQTDGGTAQTITSEHCWNTSREQAKRVVYEYGTYKTDGSRADLTNPSMSLEANSVDNPSLTNSIWAHASYWGAHVNPTDRSNVSDSTVFKNQRNSTDTDSYNLKKDYYEIFKKTREYLPLNQLDGVSFQWWVDGFKDGGTWTNQLGLLGDGIPTDLTQGCNAAEAQCPEYSGNITVSGTTVTFTITHGMDWSNGTLPFALTTPIAFTAANWATTMTDGSGWNRRMHFWDPDSHQSYTIPFSAFGDVDATTEADQVRTRVEQKISIEQLEADITAAGDGADGLMCIRECLDANGINSSIDAVFTAIQNKDNFGVLNVTPYKNVGDWFTETGIYYDNLNNGVKDGADFDIPAGAYNNIGGIKVADAPTYNIGLDNGVKKIVDVLTEEFLKYDATNQPKIDARNHDDTLQGYQYYFKQPTYQGNWTNNFGWAFHMTTVINSNTNKSALYCDPNGPSNVRGYDVKYRDANNGNASVHATGQDSYYCDYKLWEGAVATQYDIRLKQMPDYRLYNNTDSVFVDVSAPQTVVFTVPATGVDYNFGASLAGKKYKLKFEGYGELHNIPGKVVDTCTGQVKGRYVNDGWNQCYRYIHEFIIPDGTILTNASGDDLKVRALKGDEYLEKLNPTPAGITYSKTASDLPTVSNLQDLVTGDNSIGAVPATELPSAGSDDPAVIHGETVHTPPAN